MQVVRRLVCMLLLLLIELESFVVKSLLSSMLENDIRNIIIKV